jgi:hypothetical protein
MRKSMRLASIVLLASTLAACSDQGGSDTERSQPFAVTSTLTGKKVLPVRIRWVASPSVATSKVAEVDFLIDGKVGWIEHNAPYYYGSDRNWLVTTWLPPGVHRFTVRAVLHDGRRTSLSTTARVLPVPPPPAAISGTWSRRVTEGDVGTWRITINRIGWLFDDPHGGGQNQDVSYPAPGKVILRAAIEEPTFGRYKRGGAFCEHEPDPPGLYRYAVSRDQRTLTLKAVASDCREALLEGAWKSTG